MKITEQGTLKRVSCFIYTGGEEKIYNNEITTNFANLIRQFSTKKKDAPNVISILDEWKTNKQRIFELFNNQLVLKFPLEITMSAEYKKYIESRIYEELKEYSDLLSRIGIDGLLLNCLQEDIIINEQKYPKGMKVSKVLVKIMKDYEFRTIDKVYSNILQMSSLKGNICLSIDPIDFLTMGNNSYKWTSCHALCGTFQGGLLSLMTDFSTVVCYLESDNNNKFNLCGTEASNKKWRQLVHIHPKENFAIFNSSYPFDNKMLHKEVVNKLSKVFNKPIKNKKIKLNEEKISNYIKDYYYSFEEPLHFNDLLLRKNNGTHEVQETTIIYEKDTIPSSAVVVGFTPTCPVCGISAVTTHSSLECQKCDPLESCCVCACSFHIEELHVIDEELYCDTCFDGEFTYCDHCDDLIRRYSYYTEHNHKCSKIYN